MVKFPYKDSVVLFTCLLALTYAILPGDPVNPPMPTSYRFGYINALVLGIKVAYYILR